MRKIQIQEAVEVVLKYHPHAKSWDYEALCGWVSAFAREGFLACSTSDGDTINGLIMFRPVMEPEHGVGGQFNYDPEGKVIFVDFIYAPTEEVWRGLTVAGIQRLGARPLVAWERRGTMRYYSASCFVQHTLKQENHHGAT